MPARGTVPGLSVAAATVAAASEHAGAAAAQAGTELSLALTHGGCGFYRGSVLLRDLHCPHEQVTLTVDTMVDGGDLACELPAEGDSGNPNPNPDPNPSPSPNPSPNPNPNPNPSPNPKQVLIMEYLAGDEYVVDTMSRDGVHKCAKG